MEKQIHVSVRTLVESVMRTGDIDTRIAGSERMLEGVQAHRRLQRAAGPGYEAEVTLSGTFPSHGFEVTLDGRADGILRGKSGVTVDEIKSTTLPLDSIGEDSNPLHWAQAQCYAFLLARKEGLPRVTVRLTYCSADGGAVRHMQRECTAEQLAEFMDGLLARYAEWADYQNSRMRRRDRALQTLPFPFAGYRPGQRPFAAAVYRAIAGRRILFAQAPTGIGKTISTLFPAVKAVGEGHAQKIFYLTAKTVTRGVAEDAIRRMAGLHPDFKTVTLTAKDRICPHPDTGCNPDECELARGYYDRLGSALRDILDRESLMDRAAVTRYAGLHRLCPFEFGLDVSQWCDCIICDYNYVFDPIVCLRRYFQDTSGDYVFLVDEAHNLPDRAREMYSAELRKSEFLAIRRLFHDRDRGLFRAAGEVNSRMLALRRECREAPDGRSLIRPEEDTAFEFCVGNFVRQAGRWLRSHPQESAEELLEAYFDSLSFLKIAGFYSERYVTHITADNADVCLRLCCLDPADLLAATLRKGAAAVFFSATLSPPAYFRRVLGGGADSLLLDLPSPFDPGHLCLLAADRVSTRFRHRAESRETVARLLAAMVSAHTGNYLIFFPSYQYLGDVLELFPALCPQATVLRQTPEMDDAARADFLQNFVPRPGRTLAGFCVMGGVFAEGIDLPGERLIGVAVVGVGLPQINDTQNLIRSYFQRHGGRGYEYAYMYPGMNRVLQSAGRVIRSEEDRGTVLLIDDRFTSREYRALFPAHWSRLERVRGPEDVRRRLADFWAGRPAIYPALSSPREGNAPSTKPPCGCPPPGKEANRPSGTSATG